MDGIRPNLPLRLPAPRPKRPTPWEDPRPWDREQQPARLLANLPGGGVRLSGVRWGFEEKGRPQDGAWTPRFLDTDLDPKSVKEVYFGVEPFPGAGHALMIFEFATPFRNARGETDTRLVLSIEARKKEGEEWGPIVGLQKRFGVVYQLGSFSDQVQKTARLRGHRLELRRLDLSQTQREQLVKNALAEAVKDRTGEYYHTTRNSCYSGQLRLLNTVLPEDGRIGFLSPWTAGVTYRATAISPTLSGLTLKRAGLLNGETARILQPDEKLWPEAQVKPGRFQPVLRSLSERPWWNPGLRVAGALAGASAAAALGPLGMVVGGLAGQALLGAVADTVDVKTHVQYESPVPYYPAFVTAGPAGAAAAAALPGGPPTPGP